MSPRTDPTITRLDPRYPLLWRDDDTVQFGLESLVVIEVDESWVEPLLSRLQTGIRLASFDVVAHSVGAPRIAARDLLARLRPVLVADQPPPPPVRVDGVNLSDDRAIEWMRQSLLDEGLTLCDAATAGAVTVVVVEGAAAALQLAPYLRDDRPHLPVSFEQAAATIGPVVLPGRTPCLSCRDAHERGRDPAWPRVHAQLVGRSSPISAARVARAAEHVARILRTPAPSAGVMVRVSPDGRHAWQTVRHHEECLCRDLSSRSPRETATEPALLVPRSATTRSTAFARPA